MFILLIVAGIIIFACVIFYSCLEENLISIDSLNKEEERNYRKRCKNQYKKIIRRIKEHVSVLSGRDDFERRVFFCDEIYPVVEEKLKKKGFSVIGVRYGYWIIKW